MVQPPTTTLMCPTLQPGPARALASWATAWPLGGLPGHRPHADTYIVQRVRHICWAKSGLGACGVPVRRCFGAQPFAMGGWWSGNAKNLQTAGQTSGRVGKCGICTCRFTPEPPTLTNGGGPNSHARPCSRSESHDSAILAESYDF